MKRLARGLATFAAITLLLAVFYWLGRKYIWPPEDTSTIATVGIIEAPEVNLTSRIAGRIQRLDLLEGDHVERGQVVCQIEDVDIRNQLAQANGQLADAQGNLHDAERTMARYSRLFAARVISAKDRDDAVTHIERSRGMVAAAQASVRYYADQLADTTYSLADYRYRGQQESRSRGMGDARSGNSHDRRPCDHLGAGRCRRDRSCFDQGWRSGTGHDSR